MSTQYQPELMPLTEDMAQIHGLHLQANQALSRRWRSPCVAWPNLDHLAAVMVCRGFETTGGRTPTPTGGHHDGSDSCKVSADSSRPLDSVDRCRLRGCT